MEGWSAWKVVAVGTMGYGGLAALVTASAFLPPRFSPYAVLVTATILTLIGLVCAFLNRSSSSWWARLGGGAVFPSYFLLLGIRCWYAVGGSTWIAPVLLLLLAATGIALVLPGVSHALSAWLWREQFAPQTKLGKGIARAVMGLGLGGAGILAAVFGLSLSRQGYAKTVYFIGAFLSSGVAFFTAQSLSHQLWPDRPWASHGEAGKAGEEA